VAQWQRLWVAANIPQLWCRQLLLAIFTLLHMGKDVFNHHIALSTTIPAAKPNAAKQCC